MESSSIAENFRTFTYGYPSFLQTTSARINRLSLTRYINNYLLVLTAI